MGDYDLQRNFMMCKDASPKGLRVDFIIFESFYENNKIKKILKI